MSNLTKNAAGAGGHTGGEQVSEAYASERDEIIRAARLLVVPGGITELRALDATLKGDRRAGTVSGYFNSATKLADAIERIRVGKKVVNSPSLAAVAVVGRPVNGWGFWTYERAPGQWVRLRELRRR